MNKTTAALLCTATLAGLSTPPAAAQSTSTSPNAASDPAVSFATSLVAKMTQDEKIS